MGGKTEQKEEDVTAKMVKEKRKKGIDQLAQELEKIGIEKERASNWAGALNGFSEEPLEVSGSKARLTVGGRPLEVFFGRNIVQIRRGGGKEGGFSFIKPSEVTYIAHTYHHADALFITYQEGQVLGMKKDGQRVDVSIGPSLNEVQMQLGI